MDSYWNEFSFVKPQPKNNTRILSDYSTTLLCKRKQGIRKKEKLAALHLYRIQGKT